MTTCRINLNKRIPAPYLIVTSPSFGCGLTKTSVTLKNLPACIPV